jgi:hypothetical protein
MEESSSAWRAAKACRTSMGGRGTMRAAEEAVGLGLGEAGDLDGLGPGRDAVGALDRRLDAGGRAAGRPKRMWMAAASRASSAS